MEYKDLSTNPVNVVLQLVGAKWKLLIIKELLKKEMVLQLKYTTDAHNNYLLGENLEIIQNNYYCFL